MKNDLPISIKASEVLKNEFSTISSVIVKHEAYFNFQTLAAGWYEDEESVLQIALLLIDMEEFTDQLTIENMGVKTQIADDVLSYFDERENKVTCFIAMTTSEKSLLQQNKKLMAGYLKTKIVKVCNVIATQHKKVEL